MNQLNILCFLQNFKLFTRSHIYLGSKASNETIAELWIKSFHIITRHRVQTMTQMIAYQSVVLSPVTNDIKGLKSNIRKYYALDFYRPQSVILYHT